MRSITNPEPDHDNQNSGQNWPYHTELLREGEERGAPFLFGLHQMKPRKIRHPHAPKQTAAAFHYSKASASICASNARTRRRPPNGSKAAMSEFPTAGTVYRSYSPVKIAVSDGLICSREDGCAAGTLTSALESTRLSASRQRNRTCRFPGTSSNARTLVYRAYVHCTVFCVSANDEPWLFGQSDRQALGTRLPLRPPEIQPILVAVPTWSRMG